MTKQQKCIKELLHSNILLCNYICTNCYNKRKTKKGKNMTVTIDTVAELAGVSRTTVSRVLNGRGYISQTTKEKVEKAIVKLNYRPNEVARQLFKQETKIIGLIFPTVDNPFFSELIFYLETKLFNLGYKVLLGNSLNDPEKEKKYLNDLVSNRVDGLIVGAHNYNINEYHLANLPIVAIDRYINDQIPVVASDNYFGGQIATERLIASGAKNIVNTDGPTSLKTPAHKRNEAYQKVMLENGLSPKTFVIDFNWKLKEKVSAIERMFAMYPEMDGVFATNDIDAALIMQTSQQLGIDIPRQLKIVGYDGSHSTRILLPGLTTVCQPVEKMADSAVKTLLKRINGQEVEKELILPVELWEGYTC